MAESSKPVIELNITPQGIEIKPERSGSAANPAMGVDDGEMPSVTKLLNRKKYVPPTGSATPAAPSPAAEMSLSAIEAVPSGVGLEIAQAEQPNISLVPDSAISISPGGGGDIDINADVPMVSAPGRRRGTRSIDMNGGSVAMVTGQIGTPPLFSRTLILEKSDLKGFQKAIGKHKKSTDMKKLDCLGYFNSRFTEITYFEVSEVGALQGVLGFGSQPLVIHAKEKALSAEVLPGVFEAISQGEIFVGPIEMLRPEDQSGFATLGFSQAVFIGAFPMMYKKAVTGVWICASPAAQDIPQKELNQLKKFLSSFAL